MGMGRFSMDARTDGLYTCVRSCCRGDSGRHHLRGGSSVRVPCLAALTVLLLPHTLAAQSNPVAPTDSVPRSQALRTEGGIRLDGRLDEADWSKAPVTDSFAQLEPDEG